jgi:GxxExxY protein
VQVNDTNMRDEERSQDDNQRDPETYAIIGAAMEVNQELGSGFPENVYQEALATEFEARQIPFEREVALPVYFKGRPLNVGYRADFICFGSVIVETKALADLGSTEAGELLNYLKASGYRRGLLINFGTRKLQYRRMIWTQRSAASDLTT